MHRSFAQSLVVALAFILGLAPTKHYAVAQPGPQDSPPQKTEAKNLMAKEASPYLRQHAGDPVHWQPWGDEAFKRAKAEGKPVFLSIGYAACHWCHVMQRESFQDVEVAKVLNEKFISIKLDREERPDVDRIYMQAAHSLGKRGGWPLTVFLTADRKPFVVETYIPRDPFLDFIKRLSQGFETAEGRKKIQEYSKSLTDAMRSRMKRPPAIGIIQQKQISAAAEALRATEDKERGGFGSAPKFPSPSQPLWLLRQAARAGDATTALEVKRLLDALIKGGIRDHLAGGFHRYSTDANWVVPHFEKMLYDQAMLTMLFVEGWKVWGDARYEAIARETIDWVLKDMVTQEGAFISAYDADADHIEGLTYVWSLKELNELLTKQEAAVIIAWSGASAKGNWEHGRNILYEANSVRDVSTKLNVPAFDVQNLLDSARPKLLKARVTHPQPAKDTKVLLGWNALMVSALAQASFAFGEPRYLEAATRAVGVFETHMKQKSGRYHRSFTAGRAQHAAELADHAAYANACLDILAATLDREWLDRASVLQRTIDGHFLEEDGGYADSLESDLLFRTRDVHDGVRPSGSSLMLLCLARLAVITADPKVQERAEETAKSVSALVSGGPQWSPHALIAIDLLINPSPKVEAFGPNAETLLIPLRSSYSPFAHITRGKPVETAEPAREPSILVCVGQICLEPVEKASELLARIASALKP